MKLSRYIKISIITLIILLISPYALPNSNAVTIEAATIRISNKTLTLNIGQSSTLKMMVTKNKVTWTTSDKSIVTVQKTGQVTAIKAGKAKITATVNKMKYYCDVTVSDIVEIQLKSKAIAKNIIGDNSTRTIYLYLPPSYNKSNKSYPVVYFLHGYGDSCRVFMTSYKSKLDKQFGKGEKEFILVALDGNNKTGGSFYVNSPASGNWEDYITKEIVSYIDSNYRTIEDNNSRGIAGYSMGGFGALYLSLRHPDVFSSTLVFCPGVFAEDDLDSVLASWNGWTDVKQSYAQAFSPDISNTTDYGNIIKESDVEAKNSVWMDWMNGYSNWNQKLEDYLAMNKPLKSILLAYSPDDYFKWIPGGCEYLAGLLKEKNVNYSTNKFKGGHIVPSDAMENYFIPFFSENLSY